MVSFDINGAIIEFDEKNYNYNGIRNNFRLEAIDICNEFENYCLNNVLTLSQLSDKCFKKGIESIESALRRGVETIVGYGIITIDINTFKEVYCKKYLKYERLFNNLDKEILSPNKSKKNNYTNQHSLKPLIKKISQYIYDDCFNIHYAVIDVLIENKVESVSCYIDEERAKKSNALFNNYKDGFISKPDEYKVVKQIITLNPYRRDIYEFLIKEDGDFTKEIERLTEFLGYDIKDYKDELMNIYIKELIENNINDLESAKEKIRKYARYIGCKEENIYAMRLDAICTFETA
ncbi:kinase [Romboutsia sp.]|uniref:kinase n=1 Tax=Romboutsia sp. TaxID=1965302 RepID=UPI003F39BE8E